VGNRITRGLALGVALVASAARGDIVLLPPDGRFAQVRAEAEGIVDLETATPPVPGQAMWSASPEAIADGILFDAVANAVIGSFASTSTLVGNGQSGGSLSGIGNYRASSVVDLRFEVQGCETFGYFSTLGSADLDDVGSATFEFLALDSGLGVQVEAIGFQTLPGGGAFNVLSDSGQISPGFYLVRGTSEVPQSSLQGTHYAPDYSWTFNFFDCLETLIDQQPVGDVLAAGETATLSVGASAAAANAAAPDGLGGLTYQWRHGGEDLADDGRISGATSDTLTIESFGPADAGGYLVWVSNGATRQLSSLAVLELPEPDPAAALAAGGVLLAALYRSKRS
jgi:hypothetical protein